MAYEGRELTWAEIISTLLNSCVENLVVLPYGWYDEGSTPFILSWDEGDEMYVECSFPEYQCGGMVVHNHPYLDSRSARAARADLETARRWGARALVLVCRTPRRDVVLRYEFEPGCIVRRTLERLGNLRGGGTCVK